MTPARRERLLIVEDNRVNVDLLVEALKDEYALSVAVTGGAAIRVAESTAPDLILLDVILPDIDGFEVCRQLRALPATGETPIIFLTSLDDAADKAKGFDGGGTDYVTKPFDVREVRARVRSHLHAKAYRDQIENHRQLLEQTVQERTRELRAAKQQIGLGFIETVFRLAMAAEYKDPDTGAHILRIGHYCRLLARAMGMGPDFCEALFYASPLHDIGKIGVPDAILLKPGRLDEHEIALMREHTTYGTSILQDSRSRVIQMGCAIAQSHHERWDGTGYPAGLAGDAIPLVGRIVAVADVYDALRSRRCYKQSLPEDEALCIIRQGAGNHFDPEVADTFLRIAGDIADVWDDFAQQGDNILVQAFAHILEKPVHEEALLQAN
ncbi:MAG: response regulator [Candidatus Sumerlaeia bacterium]|nr:response regulator [Candidatus Sumerlaeia bacterium]